MKALLIALWCLAFVNVIGWALAIPLWDRLACLVAMTFGLYMFALEESE